MSDNWDDYPAPHILPVSDEELHWLDEPVPVERPTEDE